MSKSTNESISMPRRIFLWWFLQHFMQVIFTIYFRYRAYGKEKLDPSKGGLLLINHQSFLDPIIVGLPLNRPVCFLARNSLFKVPLLGWVLKKFNVISIDQSAASSGSIKSAIKRLKEGYLVGIYPEGTRSADGELNQIKPGFIAIAKRSKLPIYPVGISGAINAMPRNSFLIRPKKIEVVFGDPFTAEEIEELSKKENKQEFIKQVAERIQKCMDQTKIIANS